MDTQIVERIKKDLLERRDQITAELSKFAKAGQVKGEFVSDFPSYGDQADENAQEVDQYTTDIETERVLESTLKDINSSLKAIEKGDYGICKYCHQEIEEKRLLVRPFSSSCVKCKNKLQGA